MARKNTALTNAALKPPSQPKTQLKTQLKTQPKTPAPAPAPAPALLPAFTPTPLASAPPLAMIPESAPVTPRKPAPSVVSQQSPLPPLPFQQGSPTTPSPPENAARDDNSLATHPAMDDSSLAANAGNSDLYTIRGDEFHSAAPSPVISAIPLGAQSVFQVYQRVPPGSASALGHGDYYNQLPPRPHLGPHGHARAMSTAALTYRDSYEANMFAPGRVSLQSIPMYNQSIHNGPILNGPIHNGPIYNGPVHNGPNHNGSILHGPLHNGPNRNVLIQNGPVYRGAISNTVAHKIGVRAQKSYSTIKLNPTNYVLMQRKSLPQKKFFLYRASKSISGAFAVNPFLHIPEELLPGAKSGPASPSDDPPGSPRTMRTGKTSSAATSSASTVTDEPRKNLKLEVENGGIDVDLYLVGDYMPPEDKNTPIPHTTLELKLCGRYINRFPLIARLHTPNLVRPPFHLVATAVDGYVSIHLPASFHGPVTVNVNTTGDLTEHISLSNALKENSFILRESGMSRCYFVGEVGGWSKSDPLWKGDKVDVWLNSGRVRFQMFGEKDWDLVRKLTWKFT